MCVTFPSLSDFINEALQQLSGVSTDRPAFTEGKTEQQSGSRELRGSVCVSPETTEVAWQQHWEASAGALLRFGAEDLRGKFTLNFLRMRRVKLGGFAFIRDVAKG